MVDNEVLDQEFLDLQQVYSISYITFLASTALHKSQIKCRGKVQICNFVFNYYYINIIVIYKLL